MATVKHYNPTGVCPPHKNLYSTVTVIPPNHSLVFISTQWAGDENGDVVSPGDYVEQSKVIHANLAKILEQNHWNYTHIVHRTIQFK